MLKTHSGLVHHESKKLYERVLKAVGVTNGNPCFSHACEENDRPKSGPIQIEEIETRPEREASSHYELEDLVAT